MEAAVQGVIPEHSPRAGPLPLSGEKMLLVTPTRWGRDGRQRQHRGLVERLVRWTGSLLLWAAVVVLGAFGVVFAFANYPWLGIALVLLLVVAIGYAERRRRRIAYENRRRRRAQRSDLLNG
jgi:hypothetical protein